MAAFSIFATGSEIEVYFVYVREFRDRAASHRIVNDVGQFDAVQYLQDTYRVAPTRIALLARTMFLRPTTSNQQVLDMVLLRFYSANAGVQ